MRAFILAHDSEGTGNIFEMSKRYYDECPRWMKPKLKASNARELLFADLDSGYRVGTAGSEAVGRSQTNQYFHGSEVGFWDNTAELVKGVLQTVPDISDTEIIYESTANGIGNFFHQQWLQAQAGIGDFIAVFVPWFWQTEYTRQVPEGFQRTDEEDKLQELHKLTDGQLEWRRAKIIDMTTQGADGPRAFKQEYPCTAAEAFQFSGEDGLIKPDVVMRARRATNIQPMGPLVVGVDPSRGGDRFGIARRRGRVAFGIEGLTGAFPLSRKIQVCKKIIDVENPARMFVDAGEGADLVDALHDMGYADVVRAVPFGGAAMDPDRFTNKRNEIWQLLGDWLDDENLPVSIPDSDALQADLCVVQYKRDAHDRKVMERKEETVKRLGMSPDEGDALALTFTEPVREEGARGGMRVKRAYNGAKR